SLITTGDPELFGALNLTSSVLTGLLGAAALIVGLVAISRRGAPKALAAAGIALGGAALVNVFGTILYTAVLNLMYL
ncbi:MAG: hypothetical protein Q7T71_02465, partial [Herbiconiux sp.]|nr:hypothetical protein [Herbiconiux sp.]